jgi:hypothetical protein
MDAELGQHIVTLAEMAHKLLARSEASDALIAALIATHPDPASVRAEWRRVTSKASASMLLESAASGQVSAYRAQSEASFAFWNDLLDGMCEQPDD